MNTDTSESETRSPWFATFTAVFAMILWAAGISISIISFDEKNVMAYSCLNHAISELGFPHASQMTWVFDATLALGGLSLLPILHALRVNLRSRLGYIAAAFGLGTFLSLSAIGWFGLQQDFSKAPYIFTEFFRVHIEIAGVFFLGWLISVTLFTILFCLRWKERVSRLMAIAGLISLLIYPTAILITAHGDPMQSAIQRDVQAPAFRAMLHAPTYAPILSPWLDSHRPHIWWQALMEWCEAWSILLWYGAALVFLWVRTRDTAAGTSNLL